MPAAVSMTWNPGAVNSALAGAFKASAVMTAADAVRGNPAPSVVGVKGPIIRGASATIVGTGLAPVFEKGREGNYPILPGGAVGPRKSRVAGAYSYKTRAKRKGTGRAIKFTGGDGGFAAYAIGGPMKAQPFLHPAAARWVAIYYKQAARSALVAVGAGGFAAAVRSR